MFIRSIVLVFVAVILSLSSYIVVKKMRSAPVLIRENFKRLVSAEFSDREVETLKKAGFTDESLKKMILPKNWIIDAEDIPDDLLLTSVNKNWRIFTRKNCTVLTPCIEAFFSDITIDVSLKTGMERASVIIEIFGYDMVHETIPLRTENLEAGETKRIHIPVHIEQLIPFFRIRFKISGDVTFQQFTLSGRPVSLAEKGFSLVEGTLEARSKLPDPQKSDYPDCRFTLHFKGNNICGGLSCPRELCLITDGFRKNKMLKPNELKEGDKVFCLIIPYEKLPEKQKTVQQADDLELFQLENYYAAHIQKIDYFTARSTIPFSGSIEQYTSVFERKINPPLSAELDSAQQKAISTELKKINAMLSGWDQAKIKKTNSAFQKAWQKEKAKDKSGYNRIRRNGRTYVWRNVNNSFWTLPEEYRLIRNYASIDPQKLAAMASFRDFLYANGCQFIVSIVPDLFDISARIINPEFRKVPDFRTAQVVRELLKNGIETVYASDAVIGSYNRYPWAFFYPENGHPSDTVQDVITDLLSERLKRFHFPQTRTQKLFSVVAHEHVYQKSGEYQFPPFCDIGENQSGSAYQCRKVLYNGKEIETDAGSPVYIFGNSYIQTPMEWPDSFPSLLSMKMFMGIASWRVSGFGSMSTIVRECFNTPEKFLYQKKAVIFHLGIDCILSSFKFGNILEMDRNAKLIAGKTFQSFIPVKGNTTEKIDFSKKLYHAENFKIPPGGQCLVKKYELPEEERTKDSIVVIPVCAVTPCRAKLLVNKKNIPFERCESRYYWNKTYVHIPAGSRQVQLELEGEPGTVIAVGDILIYQ